MHHLGNLLVLLQSIMRQEPFRFLNVSTFLINIRGKSGVVIFGMHKSEISRKVPDKSLGPPNL